MASLDSLVNTQLGQYQILEKLGQGGMATVFKAHEQSLNRVVALKILHPSLAENEEYIKRFTREAQSAAKLNHPNIVHVYAIGEDKGHHYFAMELIKGESLADMKRHSQKISIEQALSITRQIACGLQAAHEAGLVHRDIKPSNIMVLADGTVKVADFGIAMVGGGATKLTMDGAVIGTPEYLSPEQCEGRTIDGRSDIYSLGVTLYELLAGKTPYQADTPVGMLMKIVKGEYPPLGAIVPDIPADVEALVKRMMAQKPEQRFSSCLELIAAIETIKPQARTATPGAQEPLLTMVDPQTKAVAAKNRAWIPVVAILLLAAGVGAAIYFKWIPIPWGPKGETPIQSLAGGITAGGDTTSSQNTAIPGEDKTAQTGESSQDASTTDSTNPTEPQKTFASTENTPPPETTTFTAPSTPETQKSVQKSSASDTAVQDTPSQIDTVKSPAKAASRSPHIHLLTKEESDFSELILTSIEQKLMAQGLSVIRGEPDVNGPYTALIVSFRPMGATSLRYYGKSSQQTQAFLTLSLLDLPSRRTLAAPQKEEVLFTELNANENIEEAVTNALAGFDWSVVKTK